VSCKPGDFDQLEGTRHPVPEEHFGPGSLKADWRREEGSQQVDREGCSWEGGREPQNYWDVIEEGGTVDTASTDDYCTSGGCCSLD